MVVANTNAHSLDNGTPWKKNKNGVTRSSLSLVVAPHTMLAVLDGTRLKPLLEATRKSKDGVNSVV